MPLARRQPLTINGIHLNETGDRVVAGLLMEASGSIRRQMNDSDGDQA